MANPLDGFCHGLTSEYWSAGVLVEQLMMIFQPSITPAIQYSTLDKPLNNTQPGVYLNVAYSFKVADKGEFIMKEKVEAALQKVRPMLQADGGDVELVDVQDGIVTVRLQGACGGCPMSQMTLKNGIERILKQEVPEVVSVESAP
jgi:Fe-S cluster biogenesis protein NfuA